MIKNIISFLIVLIMITSSCNNSGGKSADNNATDSLGKGSFSYDLNFLKQHDDSVVVLSNDSGKAQVIVSPKYQAKVFTSTADGDSGKSFGWVNYKAFSGTPDAQNMAHGAIVPASEPGDVISDVTALDIYLKNLCGKTNILNWVLLRMFAM